MARSWHVIEEGAKRWNRPRTEFDTVARALRVNAPHGLNEPLYPQGTGGRGEGVHLGLQPIVNLFLGVAVADPGSRAAEIVLAYRQCPFQQPLSAVLDEAKAVKPILPGATLGDGMDAVVDLLARGGKAADSARKQYADLRIILPVGRPGVIRVEMGSRHGRNADLYDARQYETETGARESLDGFDRLAILELRHLSMLAEFWADTLAHRARQTTSSDGGGQAPKTESAASRPGEAAPVGNRTRSRKIRTTNTRETAGVRPEGQALSGIDCLPLLPPRASLNARSSPADARAA